MASYILAVDFGTSSLKLGLFNERLELKYTAPGRYSYKTYSRKIGWVEQNPKEWWTVFKKSVKDIMKKYDVKKEEIVSISIGAHMGLVCVDKNGKPLRSSILFFDQRSVKQCEKMSRLVSEEDLLNVCGNRISTTQTATQIMWIKENEPKVYESTHKFLITPGYIAYLLTEEFSYDWTHASWSLLFDIRKHEWSEKMFELFKISREKFPETMLSCKILGYITNRIAEEVGLNPGTPVMVGGSDTPLAALAENVVDKNDALITAGSVSSVITCTDTPNFSLTLLNRCHVVPDRWLMQGAMNAHSNVFEWLIKELYLKDGEELSSKIFERVEAEIQRSPIGANNLIFLPYFAGERSPIWDPYARGVIFGLSFHHKRGDIMRALYEGTAYAARHNLEFIESMGIKIDSFKIVGGGAKSRIWNQIKADVLGKKIIVGSAADASMIGSAILAAYGIGWIKDLFKFKLVKESQQVFFPRKNACNKYTKLFELYKSLYLSLKDKFYVLGQI
ncbi:MAG: FGGY family carbohydrate kinase [Nitrososphaeria archaeon]|nr:FGGY family carbohydrate kinase [Nitrososphaeria archaeon]